MDRELLIRGAEGESILRLPWIEEALFVGRNVPTLFECPKHVLRLSVDHYRAALAGERGEFCFSSYGHTYTVEAVPVRRRARGHRRARHRGARPAARRPVARMPRSSSARPTPSRSPPGSPRNAPSSMGRRATTRLRMPSARRLTRPGGRSHGTSAGVPVPVSGAVAQGGVARGSISSYQATTSIVATAIAISRPTPSRTKLPGCAVSALVVRPPRPSSSSLKLTVLAVGRARLQARLMRSRR